MRIGIIGAGLSGLATAFYLSRLLTGSRIVVFEAEPQAGGTLRTVEIDGFRFETGANGFLTNKPDCLQLVRDAGLADRLVRSAPAARRRFIYTDRLHPLPESPPLFFQSDLLTWPEKAARRRGAVRSPATRGWRGEPAPVRRPTSWAGVYPRVSRCDGGRDPRLDARSPVGAGRLPDDRAARARAWRTAARDDRAARRFRSGRRTRELVGRDRHAGAPARRADARRLAPWRPGAVRRATRRRVSHRRLSLDGRSRPGRGLRAGVCGGGDSRGARRRARGAARARSSTRRSRWWASGTAPVRCRSKDSGCSRPARHGCRSWASPGTAASSRTARRRAGAPCG